MGYMCDFCSDQRSMIYCRSDAASLCLSCDRNVHSANALSKRHSRTLVCERCNSQPAFVRYVEERISLCQSCDWMNHGTSTTSVSSHKRQAINSYSGCPSAAELSSIWSFVTNSPTTAQNSSCQQDLGLMSINENSVVPPESRSKNDVSKDGLNMDSSGVWPTPANEANHDAEGASNYNFSKLGCHKTRCSRISEDDCFYEDYTMDEGDLNLENYDELFGINLNQSEELFENGGIDSLFGPNYMSCGDTGQAELVAEGSAAAVSNPVQPTCSNAASADSLMSSKTEPVLCYSTRQANSNLSFSGHEESSVADQQYCRASPSLLAGEPPWCPPCTDTSFTPFSRSNAVLRYQEKKKSRKFQKSIRYASRKARADVRKRVKGRFIKAGDDYDYDPLSQTRSY